MDDMFFEQLSYLSSDGAHYIVINANPQRRVHHPPNPLPPPKLFYATWWRCITRRLRDKHIASVVSSAYTYCTSKRGFGRGPTS